VGDDVRRGGPRDFDAEGLAKAEFDGWVGYYRREWPKVLAASVRMVRLGFGMPWPKTLRGAWFVLRANQLWAPYPQNDPIGARAYMRRFYALVADDGQMSFDPGKAAKLEVEWWRVHRLHQREGQAVEDNLTRLATRPWTIDRLSRGRAVLSSRMSPVRPALRGVGSRESGPRSRCRRRSGRARPRAHPREGGVLTRTRRANSGTRSHRRTCLTFSAAGLVPAS